MKKFLTSRIFAFILGAIIFSGVTGVIAATIMAKDVSYTPKDTTWNVDNVEDAIDSLYTKANTTITGLNSQISTLESQLNEPLINKIDFSKKNDVSYGNWQTSRTVSIDLEKGSYIIFLEFVDSYSSDSQTANIVNKNLSSFTNDLIYSNGTCEIIDADSVSVGSSTGYGSANVHITAYSNTKVFKCNFTDRTTVSYTHTRQAAYSHVVELCKLRSTKLD